MSSMAMMKKVAKEYGVNINAVQISINSLKPGDIALLTIDGKGHYVTIQSIDSEYVVYNDPIYGMVKITRAEFEKLYGGYALSSGNEEKEIAQEQQEDLIGGAIKAAALGLLGITSMIVPLKIGVGGTGSYKPNNPNNPNTNRRVRDLQNLQNQRLTMPSQRYDIFGNSLSKPTKTSALLYFYTFSESGLTERYINYGSLAPHHLNNPNKTVDIKVPQRPNSNFFNPVLTKSTIMVVPMAKIPAPIPKLENTNTHAKSNSKATAAKAGAKATAPKTNAKVTSGKTVAAKAGAKK
jgi:hypothetical protein